MPSLESLIQKHGRPDAIIDHWNDEQSQFAVWGFETVFEFNNSTILIDGDPVQGDPLNLWQAWVDKCKINSNNVSAIGWLSYDFKQSLFPHISFKQHVSPFPQIWFAKPKLIRSFSNLQHTNNCIQKPMFTCIQDIPNSDQYEKDIAKIKYYLEHGDVYQINYTHPKVFNHVQNPCDSYLAIRQNAKPHNGYFIQSGHHSILSFSPERFFRKRDGIIETYPMKGTSPRYDNPEEDKQSALVLSQSQKDKAEHLMIVDLLRNDLGKVCNFGSVKVENLYNVESFETVHQMVTRVYGTCNTNSTESDIIRALFPGGSITGAPKERAMTIIDEIETSSRGIYTGAIGTIKSNGDMDFNIAIRTMTIENHIAKYPVGGGIVWDSDPRLEWEEAHTKGAILHPFIKKEGVLVA